MGKNKRALGKQYEDLAAEYLRDAGYEIMEQNYFCHYGEIDIVAKELDTLVFVEVKYRKDDRYGHPSEAVDYKKQHHIEMAAECYIIQNRLPCDMMYRYDIVSILGSEIKLIKNAFGGM